MWREPPAQNSANSDGLPISRFTRLRNFVTLSLKSTGYAYLICPVRCWLGTVNFLLSVLFLSEYLSESATSPINVDCKTREEVELNLKHPGRYMFDAAQVGMNMWTLFEKWIVLSGFILHSKMGMNRGIFLPLCDMCSRKSWFAKFWNRLPTTRAIYPRPAPFTSNVYPWFVICTR